MIKTVAALKRAYPFFVAEVQRDAVKAEQDRIAALDALDDPKADIPELKTLIAEAKKLGYSADLIRDTAENIKAVATMGAAIAASTKSKNRWGF